MVGRGIGELVTEADELVAANEARIAARQAAAVGGRIPDTVEGGERTRGAYASDRARGRERVVDGDRRRFAQLLLGLLVDPNRAGDRRFPHPIGITFLSRSVMLR